MSGRVSRVLCVATNQESPQNFFHHLHRFAYLEQTRRRNLTRTLQEVLARVGAVEGVLLLGSGNLHHLLKGLTPG